LSRKCLRVGEKLIVEIEGRLHGHRIHTDLCTGTARSRIGSHVRGSALLSNQHAGDWRSQKRSCCGTVHSSAHCCHWGSQPATVATSRLTVVALEFWPNDLLAVQATTSPDPFRSFGSQCTAPPWSAEPSVNTQESP
jgi:hypothetical protein